MTFKNRGHKPTAVISLIQEYTHNKSYYVFHVQNIYDGDFIFENYSVGKNCEKLLETKGGVKLVRAVS